MKNRDDIVLFEQGMGSLTAYSADLWGVAYHQVAENQHPPKISGVDSRGGSLDKMHCFLDVRIEKIMFGGHLSVQLTKN